MVKNLPANSRDTGDSVSISGSGRSPGGENGNPLQYSCLENPVDRGVWQATVHGVSKSWTQLSDLHYCSNMYPSLEFIIQNNFSALKILYVPPIHPFLLQSLETTDLFTVSIVLPFLECHKDGIILYVTFSDRLLPLSNMR